MAPSEVGSAFVRLVVSVVVLDAVALAAWYGLGVAHTSERTRLVFTVTWTIATLVVVLTGMGRVRAARIRRRRAGRAAPGA